MDSITIKNYLLEFIFDLLDSRKFLSIFGDSQEGLQTEKNGSENGKSSRISSSTGRPKTPGFNVMIIFESFLVSLIAK